MPLPKDNKPSLFVDPFRELRDMQRSWMTDFWNLPSSFNLRTPTSDFQWNPSCELAEDEKNYTFSFDLPGLNKDNIKLEIHDKVLTVSGERKEEKKSDDKKNHFSEVFYGSFSRSFGLPNTINMDAVKANFENGVLKVIVPKESNKQNSRRVEIQ